MMRPDWRALESHPVALKFPAAVGERARWRRGIFLRIAAAKENNRWRAWDADQQRQANRLRRGAFETRGF